MLKASNKEVFLSITCSNLSLETVIMVSTLSASSAKARSAIFFRCPPSNMNGLVTTATVKAPNSRAISATIGEAPEPVPPPKPTVIKTMLQPFKTSLISFCDSSAAAFPSSGFIPAPKPRVTVFPI